MAVEFAKALIFWRKREKEKKVTAQRFALAACCHADQLTKRTMFFERKNALKRNVATRQPARFVGRGLMATIPLAIII